MQVTTELTLEAFYT